MKKNIKRILSSLLVLVMVVGLAACGGGEKKPAKDGGNAGSVDAGKAQGKITVVSREDGSGTRSAFVEIVGILDENKNDMTVQTANIQSSTGNVVNVVKGDNKAIGYISLGSVDDSVKPLKVDGVEATDEKVLSGDYKIARPFLFAYKSEKGLSPAAADFVKFTLSKEGQEVVNEAKFITVDKDAKPFEKTEGIKGNIKLTGSTSVEPLAIKLKEAYEKLNPDVTIEIQANGSGQGIKEALDGSNDIGMSSRELKEDEKLDSKAIAKDGIAVIVAPGNPLEDISMESVKEIYLGNIQNWEDIK